MKERIQEQTTVNKSNVKILPNYAMEHADNHKQHSTVLKVCTQTPPSSVPFLWDEKMKLWSLSPLITNPLLWTVPYFST